GGVAGLIRLWAVIRKRLGAIGNLIGAAFSALDQTLVWLATPFGVKVFSPTRRYAQMLSIYACVYLLALLPVRWVPLIALAVGYIGVLAIGRAWVKNEKMRTAIAKKL